MNFHISFSLISFSIDLICLSMIFLADPPATINKPTIPMALIILGIFIFLGGIAGLLNVYKYVRRIENGKNK